MRVAVLALCYFPMLQWSYVQPWVPSLYNLHILVSLLFALPGDVVVCLGVSEVGSGSDVASIKTTARPSRDGSDLIINGGKMWITNSAQADWMCLLANTSEGDAHRNKSLICLPMDTKGVTVARTLRKLGMHSSDTAEIFFEDVRVPRKYMIGEEGKGFIYQMQQFQRERLWGSCSGEEGQGTNPMFLAI